MRELSERFLFTLSLCDRFGYWLPSGILMMMQEMGGRHGQMLGLGRAELLAKNAVWVLARNEYRLYRLPQPGDIIIARTYPGQARRGLYPRYHTFELEDGTLLAEGIGGIDGLDVQRPQTNIVFATASGGRGPALLAHLQAQGVLATGLIGLRFVTHLDVDRAGIERAIAAIRGFFEDH